ncbi:hypothetical protein CAC42_2445 [Sphaceloma murrayae]|uniref:Uncharacterized protein n=1 Tax=Sphaceloma murrayae TaxID=2082308 RepID=A0A2K1QW32_9PEZI|nr:hypothetical protein CAC42_2445 [Sphaceloma murrayae]
MQEIDLLILGAGWTSTFLVPLLQSSSLTYALTTTDGRSAGSDNTIRFKYDPSAEDQSYFASLPAARYVLVTFPVKGTADANKLVDSYVDTHPRVAESVRWIVLGSTGIWQKGSRYTGVEKTSDAGSRQRTEESHWLDRYSPYDRENERAIAEEAYLGRGALVLNLSGLWDGEKRDPKNWVERVATTKEAVEGKTSLHMVHGVDVGRALLAIVQAWEKDRGTDECKRVHGQRWMLTDGFVYDWWALFAGWADVGSSSEVAGQPQPSKQSQWVYELMNETGVKALPRSVEQLGRCYDSREFWTTFGLGPLKARI